MHRGMYPQNSRIPNWLQKICNSVQCASKRYEKSCTVINFSALKEIYETSLSFKLNLDVKPSNILVNTQGQIKLCDFGVSVQVNLSTCTGLKIFLSFSDKRPNVVNTFPRYSHFSAG